MGFCKGGAEALGEAGSDAIENTLERLAERASDAPCVPIQPVWMSTYPDLAGIALTLLLCGLRSFSCDRLS